MRNFIQPGRTITIPSPGVVSSGDLVVAGNFAGIAAGDAANGEPLDLTLEGCFSVPKATAAVFTVGAIAYWDGSEVSDAESDGEAVGVVIEAAGAGVLTAKIRLSN